MIWCSKNKFLMIMWHWKQCVMAAENSALHDRNYILIFKWNLFWIVIFLSIIVLLYFWSFFFFSSSTWTFDKVMFNIFCPFYFPQKWHTIHFIRNSNILIAYNMQKDENISSWNRVSMTHWDKCNLVQLANVPFPCKCKLWILCLDYSWLILHVF